VSCIVLRFRIDLPRLDVDMLVTRATYAGLIPPPPRILRAINCLLNHYACVASENLLSPSSGIPAGICLAWQFSFIQRASVLRSCFNGGGYLVNHYSGRCNPAIGTTRAPFLISQSSTIPLEARMVALGCRILRHMC
jgi:hypothetical protein